MQSEMTKTDLLECIRAARVEWEAALAAVPARRLTEPGAAGEWTVKDVLAHVSYWEDWQADQLEALQRGETTMVTRQGTPPGALSDDTDERNAAIYALYRERPLPEVLDMARLSYPRLLALVERLSDAQLNDRQTYAWTFGYPVWRMIAGNTYTHHPKHAADLRAWLARATV
jgi:hypothetical protein